MNIIKSKQENQLHNKKIKYAMSCNKTTQHMTQHQHNINQLNPNIYLILIIMKHDHGNTISNHKETKHKQTRTWQHMKTNQYTKKTHKENNITHTERKHTQTHRTN